MARLTNECRWSASRESTFAECRKKYWYSYYGSWEGWPKTPYDSRPFIDPLASYLYMLKNMQPACMFIGSAVHKAIEECLKSIEQTKKLPPLEILIAKGVQRVEDGITGSLQKKWKEHPKKNVNLLEHYYASSPVDGDQLKEKATTCITNWYTSPCIQKLALSPKARWLGIETPHTFTIEKGIEAIVVYDFFLSWNSTVTIIFDWKTGKPSQKVEDQLLAYALAANTLFGTPYESIILSPFYVADSPVSYKKYGAQQEITIDVERVNRLKMHIITSAKEMLAHHTPHPDPVSFDYCQNRFSCQRCQYKELCQKAKFEPKTLPELQELLEEQ